MSVKINRIMIAKDSIASSTFSMPPNFKFLPDDDDADDSAPTLFEMTDFKKVYFKNVSL